MVSLELEEKITPVVMFKRRIPGTPILDYIMIDFLENGEILIEYTIDAYTGLHSSNRYYLRQKPGRRLYRLLSELSHVFLNPTSEERYVFEIEVYSQEAFLWLSTMLEKYGIEYPSRIPAT